MLHNCQTSYIFLKRAVKLHPGRRPTIIHFLEDLGELYCQHCQHQLIFDTFEVTMSSLILSKMMASKCSSDSFLGRVTPSANSQYKLSRATTINMCAASTKTNLILKPVLSSNSLSCSPFLSGPCLCNNGALVMKAPIVRRIAAEANTPGSPDPKVPEKPTSDMKVDDLAAAVKAAQRLKIAVYFAVWWSLNVVFNIYNKKVLNVYPFPWLTSTLSLAAGSAIMLVSWAFKIVKPPEVDCDFWKNLAPVIQSHYNIFIFQKLYSSQIIIILCLTPNGHHLFLIFDCHSHHQNFHIYEKFSLFS